MRPPGGWTPRSISFQSRPIHPHPGRRIVGRDIVCDSHRLLPTTIHIYIYILFLYIYIKTHSGCLFSPCSADLIGQVVKGNHALKALLWGLLGPSSPHCTSPPRGYSEPRTRGCPGPRHTGERPGPHPPFLSSVKHFYTAGGVRIQNKVHFLGFLCFLLLGTKRVGREGLRAQTLREKPVNLLRLN